MNQSLQELFIQREGYNLIAYREKEKPGRDVSLRTSAVSDQDQSICSKNDPLMNYVQGKKHVFPVWVTELFGLLEDQE